MNEKEINMSTLTAQVSIPPIEEEISISLVEEPVKEFNLLGDNQVQEPAIQAISVAEISQVKPVSNRPPELGMGSRVKVDPSTFRSPTAARRPGPNIHKTEDRAYGDLEAAITRKQQEMKDTMEAMMDHDESNRMAISEGIEENSGIRDMQYTAEVLAAPDTISHKTEDDLFDDELEKEINDTDRTAAVAASHDVAKKVVVAQPLTLPTVELSPEVEEDIDFLDDEEIDLVEEEEDTVPNEIPIEVVAIHDIPTIEPVKDEPVDQFAAALNAGMRVRSGGILNVNPEEIKQNDLSIDPADFSDIDIDDESADQEDLRKKTEDLRKKGLQNIKSEILSKLINTASKFDVSAFTVSKKTATLQQVLRKAKEDRPTKVLATWALPNSKRSYVASSLTGPEIVMLSAADEGSDSMFMANSQQARILYNHDENEYKPPTFEGWCKTIPYSDLDDIFFAEYMATFNNANYLPYECINQDCHNMELKDHLDIIGTMVKFKNDTRKAEFLDIREKPLSADESSEYESVIIPINSYIAIGFKLPSIYNMLIELRSVGQKFIEKYAAIITVVMSIDDIYNVNMETQEFVPIDRKVYPTDISKTFKTKIATFAKVLNTLNPNEYNILVAYINSLTEKTDYITNYVIPEEKCSKCNSVITESPINGKDLVFSHQRLVDIATISIE